jgi:DNA polymerase III subunit delta'
MPFRDLINQQHAKSLLQAALRTGQVSHAYLFAGPAGVGRATAARAFAQALLCQSGGADACDACAACRKVRGDVHPDFRIIGPGRTDRGAERRGIVIDQIRDLKRDAAYPPYEARWKVYILEDAEAMRAEAANSLLKILEEPPAGVVIIMLAESTAAMLPTLVSRAQLIRFIFVPASEIAKALVARGVAPERARFLAAISGGRPGRALAAADAGDEPFLRRGGVVSTLEAIERGDVVLLLDAADVVSRARDDVEQWLDIALLWIRDLIVWQVTEDPAMLVNLDSRREITEWANRASSAGLRRTAAAIEEAKTNLRRNLNPRLVLEELFARMELGPERAGTRPA